MRVSVEDNYVPIIVYPIMEYGNMHQFLTLCRVAPADSPLSVSTRDGAGNGWGFLSMCWCPLQELQLHN